MSVTDSVSSNRSTDRVGGRDRVADRSGPSLNDDVGSVTATELSAETRNVVGTQPTTDAFQAVSSTHTVQRGDTLSEIAQANNVRLSDVIAANPQIRNPDLIHPGQEINLPGGTTPTRPTEPAAGVVSRGSRGPAVEAVQRQLNSLGYNSGTVDGAFGPITESAVRRFQHGNELPVTGRVDDATLARLNSPDAVRAADVPRGEVPNLETYPPGSPEQIALFEEAARQNGLPVEWASSPGLINILRRESNGRVGVPNYTYGARAQDPARWGEIHDELRNGVRSARSSATGLGQLLLSNVDRYYPNGRAGIGNPVEEAAGMMAYIQDRYGNPETAWARYGTVHEGY